MSRACVCVALPVKCNAGCISRAWGFRVPSHVFKIVLIKPSHYDEDGYVIQWWRSLVPSNSLASVHGLLSECDTDKALGPDIKIDVEAYDECNTVISAKKTIRAIRAAGAGFVGLVGVQSNQFPRALDLARQFRAANIPVVLGGFHVSGCLSMLPELPVDLKEALDLGVILYAGEGECRTRLPVRVLVLHHHQRAGPQIALPHAGRCRGDRARKRQARHHALLRHRRQLRPQ